MVSLLKTIKNWSIKSECRLFYIVFSFSFVLRASSGIFQLFTKSKIYAFDNDPAVYYTAGKLLLKGILPYKDFLLVHPPGTVYYMLPFAFLGKFLSDYTAMQIANFFGIFIISFAYAKLCTFIYKYSKKIAFISGLLFSAFPLFLLIERNYVQELIINVFLIIAIITLVKIIKENKNTIFCYVLLGFALAFQFSVKIIGIINIFIIFIVLLLLKKYSSLIKTSILTIVFIFIINIPLVLSSPKNALSMILTTQFNRKPQYGIFDKLFFFINPIYRTAFIIVLIFSVVFFLTIKCFLPKFKKNNDIFFFIGSIGTALTFSISLLLAISFSIFHYSEIMAVYFCILVPYFIKKINSARIKQTLAILLFLLALIGLNTSLLSENKRSINLTDVKKMTKTNGCIWSNFMSLQIAIDNLDNIIDKKCPFAVDFYGLQIADYAHIKYPENNNKTGQIGDTEKIAAKQIEKSNVLLITTEIDSLVSETFNNNEELKYVLTSKNKLNFIEIWKQYKALKS